MKFTLVMMSMIMAGVFDNAQGTESSAPQQNSGAAVEQKAEAPVKKEKKHKKHSKKEKAEKSEKNETKQ